MTTKRIVSIAVLVVLTVGPTLAQQLQQRFDMIVRQGFFSGFADEMEQAVQQVPNEVILGGFDDRKAEAPKDESKRFIIRGTVLMGGVEVRN